MYSRWHKVLNGLDDTHNLHQSEFGTGPHGVGFRRHIYFRLGPQWFMWGGLSGWYTHSPPVRVPHWSSWGGIQKTHVFQTRSTMVHVGWVTVWYTHSPPVTVPHWSSGGGIQKAHLFQTRSTMVHVGWVVWMIHTFSTCQSSTLVLMGWDSEDTCISN